MNPKLINAINIEIEHIIKRKMSFNDSFKTKKINLQNGIISVTDKITWLIIVNIRNYSHFYNVV